MVRKKGVAEFEETAPDDFDPANPYKDPVAMLEMREHIVREKWIDIEKAKILRDKVSTSTPPAASVGARMAAIPPSTARRLKRLSQNEWLHSVTLGN
ncbi:hypothetical protein V6N13_108513 [Hibiscus sabdariffa]|uniref:Uncharacterized protein n=1 Tax=Hibiscus sabdariffa TaxID=183260 RepID=A0ABR2SSD9_9ROSI